MTWEIKPGALVATQNVSKPNPALWLICVLSGHHWVPLLRYSWKRKGWYWFGEHCRRCDEQRPPNLFRIDLHRGAVAPWLKGFR